MAHGHHRADATAHREAPVVARDGVEKVQLLAFDVDNHVWVVGDDEECVVIDAPHDVAPILELVGGRKVEHLQDNIQSLKIKLTSAQIEHLESVVPFDAGFPNNFVGEDPHLSGQASFLLAGAAPMAFVRSERPIGHE